MIFRISVFDSFDSRSKARHTAISRRRNAQVRRGFSVMDERVGLAALSFMKDRPRVSKAYRSSWWAMEEASTRPGSNPANDWCSSCNKDFALVDYRYTTTRRTVAWRLSRRRHAHAKNRRLEIKFVSRAGIWRIHGMRRRICDCFCHWSVLLYLKA